MRENSKGSLIILTVIGIATLLVAVIGATFAYFTATVKNNPTAPNVTVQSKMLVINFNSGREIEYKNVIPGRPVWENRENAENIYRFSVSNDMNATSAENYNIYLNVTENDFETDNVVFLLKQTSSGQPLNTTFDEKDKIDSSNAKQYFNEECNKLTNPDTNCVQHIFKTEPYATETEGKTVNLGFVPAGFKNNKMKIGSATLGNGGSTDEWEFEIWVNEIGEEQNEDQGKIIKAYLTIEAEDPSPQTNEKELVTTTKATP